jgi:hypothetical protein
MAPSSLACGVAVLEAYIHRLRPYQFAACVFLEAIEIADCPIDWPSFRYLECSVCACDILHGHNRGASSSSGRPAAADDERSYDLQLQPTEVETMQAATDQIHRHQWTTEDGTGRW